MGLLQLLAKNRPGDVGTQKQESLARDLAALGQRVGQCLCDETFRTQIDVQRQIIPNRLCGHITDRCDFGIAKNPHVATQGA